MKKLTHIRSWLVKHKESVYIFAILSIVLLASYLRLHNISGYLTFLGDEGRDVMVVKKMIVDHKFTLLGPTSSVGGFFLGPIYYYFMLPFLWLWNLDPTGPAVMVALFGIATVFLVYKVGKEMFHPVVGIIASSLYALSPLVIAYSRSSWNPNLVQFFSLFLVYNMWKSLHRTNTQGKHELFWVGLSLGIGLQLHYVVLFLCVFVFLWYVLFGRTKDMIVPYVYGLMGFLVGFSGFLAFEIRHRFPNTQTIFRFLLYGEETGFQVSHFIHTMYDVLYRVFGRLVLRLPDSLVLPLYSHTIQTLWHVSVVLTLIAVAILFIIFLYKKTSKRFELVFDKTIQSQLQLFALWLVVPIVLFGLYQKGIYDYYFGLFFSLPFFLVGILIFLLLSHKYLRYVGVAIYISLLVFNWQGRPFLHPPNNQLQQAMTIASHAFEKTDGKPFNFALIADGNSDHVYRYFFEVWGNAPKTIENEVLDPERNTVTDQLIVICEKPECKPLGHPLWEIAGFGQAEIVDTERVSFVTIMKLVHVE